MLITQKDILRFNTFFIGGNTTRCWEWLGSKDDSGYGLFWLNCRSVTSHRVAYAIQFGDFDDAFKILHSCDNPPCVNPTHLFVGTQLDNIQDMDAKGRRYIVTGEAHFNTKFSDELKDSARVLRQMGHSVKEVASMTGMSYSHTKKILLGLR